ncbi:hypothetical protein [Phormidium nigroviride]|uniref:hypothetical protein n=1 Tax=Phormidium nigroviride TaxID=482564 RepID=UPI00167F4B54|nr:hypothetical protein [Oscillatoria nigro-viridis]
MRDLIALASFSFPQNYRSQCSLVKKLPLKMCQRLLKTNSCRVFTFAKLECASDELWRLGDRTTWVTSIAPHPQTLTVLVLSLTLPLWNLSLQGQP